MPPQGDHKANTRINVNQWCRYNLKMKAPDVGASQFIGWASYFLLMLRSAILSISFSRASEDDPYGLL
jgi:hypothetical protein